MKNQDQMKSCIIKKNDNYVSEYFSRYVHFKMNRLFKFTTNWFQEEDSKSDKLFYQRFYDFNYKKTKLFEMSLHMIKWYYVELILMVHFI